MPPRRTQRAKQSDSDELTLEGEVTVAQLEGLRERAISSLGVCKSLRVVCEGLTYIDAAGLQTIASLKLEASKVGVAVSIVGVSDSVRNDASLLGMAEALTNEKGQGVA